MKIKETYAVTVNGDRITRFRTDKVRTISIAKKTRFNLDKSRNHHRFDVGVMVLNVRKPAGDIRSFAMIANLSGIYTNK